MIGIDTKVLVHFLVQDEPDQSLLAKQLFVTLRRGSQGYISLTTVLETVWVLQSCYQAHRSIIAESIEALLDSQELAFQDSPSVYLAVQSYKEGVDFADALIFRSANGQDAHPPLRLTKRYLPSSD